MTNKSLLVKWLKIIFAFSFVGCISIFLYYVNYYMGESKVLQDIYFTLFYISILCFVLIIIITFFKNK